MGLTLAQLHLEPVARHAAYRLQQAFPHVQFTSGRRTLDAQARIMVENEREKPGWVRSTYKAGGLLADYLEWNRGRLTWDELEQGVLRMLVEMPHVDLISRHLRGLAFDLHPMIDQDGLPTTEGAAVIDYIRRHLQPETVLLREGGLIRWHVQFAAGGTTDV